MSTEQFIATCFQYGLVTKLNLDPGQCHISVTKMRDANWAGKPFYLVVPGSVRYDGGGRGAQDGGSLIRVQEFSVVYYGQTKLDQYSLTDQMLQNSTYGSLDAFEKIRQIFAMTFFSDGTTFLLSEPVYLARENQSILEDSDLGLFSREFVFSVQYSTNLPSSITLTIPTSMIPA